MSQADETPDYYTLLGVTQKAPADGIRSAFHRFAREHHPDNFGADDSEERAQHERLYRLGTEAYRVLLDPQKRQLYDEGLAQGHKRYSEDRAKEKRKTRRPVGGVELRSTKARMFYGKARQALAAGDLPQAKLNFQMALHQEPSNEALKEKLDEVLEKMKKG